MTTSNSSIACRISVLVACITLVAPDPGSAQTFVETRVVTDGLVIPWELLWGPDNWLWVTERPGRVSRVNPATGFRRQILEVPNSFEFAEVGMLGMAVHPSFGTSPYVYVVDAYERDTSIVERLVRYRYVVASDTLIRDRVLLDSIPANLSHGGCRLMIGPDNTLYFTLGDTHDDPYSAPNHNRIIGKTLRINLDGTVPSDNPWPENAWPTNLIWTVGHRNSQGLAFSPDGTLYATEHGTDADDEINLLMKGRSYGWPFVHGMCDNGHDPNEKQYCIDSNVVEPLITFSPTVAPAGVSYYDHPLIDEFRRSLLVTTLGIVENTPQRPTLSLVQLKLSADGRSVTESLPWFSNQFGRLRDVCVAPDGRVFIATSNRDARFWPSFEKYPSDQIIEITPREDSAWVSTEATISTLDVCMSDSIDVPYSAGGTFRTGNRFVVQLSNANGSFDRPTEIGTLPPFGGQFQLLEGSIGASIPDSIASGEGYRIRIAATRPNRTSSEFARAVSIHARPRPALAQNDGILSTAPGFAEYRWLMDGSVIPEATANTISPQRSGSYAVVVVDSFGCTGMSAPIDVEVSGVEMSTLPSSSVRVYPNPATDRLSIEIAITKPGAVELVMTDMTGARTFVRKRVAEHGTLLWDIPLTDVAPGIYVVEIRTPAGRWADNVVVESNR